MEHPTPSTEPQDTASPKTDAQLHQYGWVTRLLAAALFASVGLFIVALYLGIVSMPTGRTSRCHAVFCDPYHWQILSFGIAFLAAGLTFLVPASMSVLGRFCGYAVLISLLSGLIGTFFFK